MSRQSRLTGRVNHGHGAVPFTRSVKIMRQAEPNQPEKPESSEMPLPQELQMKIYDASRKRREAKGVSGSLPTRKG
ncbi:unnamed protein product [Pieris macdunnoughi]|uniref:Uncharacterized protein n=1 Tax=Pieris macdunnoughi TaxID=345717 RepID=A0A821QTL1_9NEOP|nr:unnamed protein product [Pieris macdunnoughi]